MSNSHEKRGTPLTKALAFIAAAASAALAVGASSCAREITCIEDISDKTSVPMKHVETITCDQLLDAYPSIASPPEGYQVFTTENTIKVAHCSEAPRAVKKMVNNQACYDALKREFAIQPVTRCVAELTPAGPKLDAIAKSYTHENSVSCFVVRMGYETNKEGNQCKEAPETAEKKCNSPHEIAHAFLEETILERNQWLNEGFATYASSAINSDLHQISCTDAGWTEIYAARYGKEGSETSGRYVPLNKSRLWHEQNGTTHDAYVTGACFWQAVRSHITRDDFKSIMLMIEETRKLKNVYGSLRDGIIGSFLTPEQIGAVEKRFGRIEKYFR